MSQEGIFCCIFAGELPDTDSCGMRFSKRNAIMKEYMIMEAFRHNDWEAATSVEPLEQVIDHIKTILRSMKEGNPAFFEKLDDYSRKYMLPQ